MRLIIDARLEGGETSETEATIVAEVDRKDRSVADLPISSSIAESAVNLVVNHRMAKKQQMRWTDEGAHCLAQVRVAVLNEEFSVKKLAVLTKTSAVANSPSASRAA